MRLIAHGGAGGAPANPEARQAALDAAAEAGVEVSARGEAGAGDVKEAAPIDAVEATVRALESDPRFNAGVGGAVQSDGAVRTDAGLMTSDREVGAVAGLTGVEHAVTVARAVAEETPHVLLAGDPAVDFAESVGVEVGADLATEGTRARWADADPPDGATREQLAWVRERFGEGDVDDAVEPGDGRSADDHDTVGAVATDGDRFAAATSTGGRWFALAGRVGDVPQVGSGFYCSPAGGASATGAGEDIARTLLSRRAVAHLEAGRDASTAAERAIEEFEDLTGSDAGVIVLDGEGAGSAFDAAAMQTAVARE